MNLIGVHAYRGNGDALENPRDRLDGLLHVGIHTYILLFFII